MLPRDWDPIAIDLDVLYERLERSEQIEGEHFNRWRRESVLLIPAGCFVWRDDFEAAFREAHSRERYSWTVEREGDRALDYSPFLEEEVVGVLMAGFERPCDRSASVGTDGWKPPEPTPLLKVVVEAFEFWTRSAEAYPDKKSGKVQEWIATRMAQAGMPESNTLIDHIETIIAPRVYGHMRQKGARHPKGAGKK